MFVISTGRNPNHYLYKCVFSVQQQLVQPTEHIVIDDLSDDETSEILDKLPDYENLTIVRNTDRKFRLKNIYDHAIDKDPEDIICILDSDDWLTDVSVLATIKQAYESNPSLEYIYSQYILSHGEMGCSRPIPSPDWDPYTGEWITSHMCTFKVKAIKDIPVSNFLDWNGEWFQIATDHALILPVIHRLKEKDSGLSAIGFISRPLYVHTFYGNPSKPRSGTPEADARASLAVRCSTFIKQRGFVEE